MLIKLLTLLAVLQGGGAGLTLVGGILKQEVNELTQLAPETILWNFLFHVGGPHLSQLKPRAVFAEGTSRAKQGLPWLTRNACKQGWRCCSRGSHWAHWVGQEPCEEGCPVNGCIGCGCRCVCTPG